MMPALERGHAWFMETDMRTFSIPSLATAAGLAGAMALGSAGSSVAAPAYGNVALVRAATAGNVIAVEDPDPALKQFDSASGGGGLAHGILPCVASGAPPQGPPTRLAYPWCPPLIVGVRPRVDAVPPRVYAVRPRVDTVQPRVHTVQPRVHAVRPHVHAVRPRGYAARPGVHALWPGYWGPHCASFPQYGACAAAWYP
jgi:hypothetical protein